MPRDVYDILTETMDMQRISYQKLADKVGLSKMGLSKSLKKKTLTLDTFEKLCTALELNPAEMWPEEANITHDSGDPELAKSHLINQKLAAIARLTKEIQEELKY